MGSRRPFAQTVLCVTALLAVIGCAPRQSHREVHIPGVIGAPPGAVASAEHVETVSVDPRVAARMHALGRYAGGADAEDREGAASLSGAPASTGNPARASSASVTAPHIAVVPSIGASDDGSASSATPHGVAPGNDHPTATDVSMEGSDVARSSAPAVQGNPPFPQDGAAAPAQITARPDPRLAEAQRRIARLERLLEAETRRRQDVESEMTRLLEETSVGPYDQADGHVVETHLRQQLDRARREVRELRSALSRERRARDEVERRFATLHAQLQAAPRAGDAPAPGVNAEELAALQERQRRVLANIRQDLEASKERERELRGTIEQLQGDSDASLTETVSGLRTENTALQLRLEEEHRRNVELKTKLQLAQRVTDLIFRMQANGSEAAPATELTAP